jgi:hypothetical protein
MGPKSNKVIITSEQFEELQRKIQENQRKNDELEKKNEELSKKFNLIETKTNRIESEGEDSEDPKPWMNTFAMLDDLPEVSQLPDSISPDDQKILAMEILKRVGPKIFQDTIWDAPDTYISAVDEIFTEKFPLGKRIQVKLNLIQTQILILTLNITLTLTLNITLSYPRTSSRERTRTTALTRRK